MIPAAAVDILKGFSGDPASHQLGLQLFRQLLSGRPGRQASYVTALLELASGTPQEVRGGEDTRIVLMICQNVAISILRVHFRWE